MVIIAEDDPDDRLLIKDAIKEASQQPVDVFFVQDGAEMLDYLYHRGKFRETANAPHPELVLLDLNMPKKGGMEVLEEIKQRPGAAHHPGGRADHLARASSISRVPMSWAAMGLSPSQIHTTSWWS